jgi:hypothetical protein
MVHTIVRIDTNRTKGSTSGLSFQPRFLSHRTRSSVRLLFVSAVIPVFGVAQVSLYPGNNIQQAVDQHPASTTFLLNAGIYRLQSVQPKDGDTFIGMPGALLSGAAVLTGFSRAGALWVAGNQNQQGQLNGYCDQQHPECMYPEDLFFDNAPLLHVQDLASVTSGSWFFDYANHRIYFADDPTGHTVEISTARSAFYGSARNVTIRGLTIEKYAIPAQFGAIGDQYPGPNWIISNNEVRWNHGAGINLASGSQALNNHVHHNGQKGIGGNGQNLIVEGNEISFSNWAGFDIGWEAGGAKFAQTNFLTVRKNFIHDNGGAGLWNDIDSINTLYENNTVENNLAGGIQYEISYAATIRYNTVRNNANFPSTWMWGAQILIMNSRDVAVYGNRVDVAPATGNGIGIIQQNRGDGAYGPHIAANNYVHHNSITHRHSPNGSSGLVGDYYQQALLTSQNNRFDYNSYHVTDPWASAWQWGGYMSWDGMHQIGQELHGTVDTKLPVWP